jgi:hypothetical protein
LHLTIRMVRMQNQVNVNACHAQLTSDDSLQSIACRQPSCPHQHLLLFCDFLARNHPNLYASTMLMAVAQQQDKSNVAQRTKTWMLFCHLWS